MKKLLISAAVLGLLAAVVVAVRPTEAANPYPSDIAGSPLRDGDLISANQSAGDPDIFIVKLKSFFGPANPGDAPEAYNGFKRLFLNPAIFRMYGHLGGFERVRQVSAQVRDSFVTSGLFRNCESGDLKVWATEVTGEDDGVLHHVQMTGDQAALEDPRFFDKVFCINNNEDNFYARSITPYYRLADIPLYFRRTCQPRPACLDSVQYRCMLPEPAEGWCPTPTYTPQACIPEGDSYTAQIGGLSCCTGLVLSNSMNIPGSGVLNEQFCLRQGCYMQQVQCIRAPCPPILVCPATNASITVISPNGNESYTAGQTEQLQLQWSSSCEIKSFNIDLYAGGSYVQSMIQGMAQGICNAGDRMTAQSSWIIPGTLAPRSDYRVRISGNSNGNTVYDQSDSTFSIRDTTASRAERNLQRQQAVQTILSAVVLRYRDNRGVWPTTAACPVLPATATVIGRNVPTAFNLESCLVPQYLSSMPIDPIGGSADWTGYLIQQGQDINRRITVSTPYIETGDGFGQTYSLSQVPAVPGAY